MQAGQGMHPTEGRRPPIGELLARCSGLVVGAPTYWAACRDSSRCCSSGTYLCSNTTSFTHGAFPAVAQGQAAAIITASLSPFPFNLLLRRGPGRFARSRPIEHGRFRYSGNDQRPDDPDMRISGPMADKARNWEGRWELVNLGPYDV